jgi:hypothetical protein
MSIAARFKSLKGKKGANSVDLIVQVMKYFGWSYQDVKDLKIPSFIQILIAINKAEKEASRQHDKSKVSGNSRSRRR